LTIESPMATGITPEIIAEHGLNVEEYARVCDSLGGRAPSYTELGVFSVMWSEHCSYKSSRVWLAKLPTTGPQVICGPGENAGIVDIGDGQVAVFKMESHNHPSYIEPYQGAATGVGGIMRDVFTMGARPIANMNALRFGSPEHQKTRHLVSGVVSGIGGYGNCIGVPTVGGEVNFDQSFDGNILVNAMCVGLADANKIFYAAASGVGNPVVYVGSKTGRDGIHGATMASAEFDDDSEEKRPTVQVGDPFTEKLLLEACLELMAGDAIIGIQDMGAAGLTSSGVEMADKGGVGIELDLDRVPCREEGMTAYEMLLSESQERMLMVLTPGREEEAQKIFEKWGLDFAVIGITTDSGHFVTKHKGEIKTDIPLDTLANNAPKYNRPYTIADAPPTISAEDVPAPNSLADTLVKLMGSPDLCSRRWVWEQYDHMVMGDTVGRPGGDAAVVRIHGYDKSLAITTDVTPRYVAADAVEGGKQAVAETWRNLSATGATPLAITDCMNFGNPERPEIMGQFAGAIQGMALACEALSYPVVSGNVSLYNETNGQAILPTPAIGGIGLIKDTEMRASASIGAEGDSLLLIGAERGHLGQSIYQRDIIGSAKGAPPPVDLDEERKNGDFVRSLIEAGDVAHVHDCSDGGLWVAVAEMALVANIGADISLGDNGLPAHAILFGEDQGRYILSVDKETSLEIMAKAKAQDIHIRELGFAHGDSLNIEGGEEVNLDQLRQAHESWLPDYMNCV
jgi:phosphoribosylformylglycinamidine synthase subunit PurL